MASQSGEKQCGARRLNGLSRSLKKRAEQFFTIPALLTASEWSFGFNHIASDVGIGLRLDLPIGPLRLDYGLPLSEMDITVAVVSTSTWAINFERIYVVAV